MTETSTKTGQRLAIDGGPKAVESLEARGEPKLGVDEFMAVAKRFGYSEKTLDAIRAAVSDLDAGGGAFMGRYGADDDLAANLRFEATAREKFGVRHALSVTSGTAALHAAFVAVGAGPDTEVICPAVGFMATAAAVITSGGTPVFCDIDESMTIDPAKIEASITPRTVAIAPTHWGGAICDMDAIMEIARRRNLKVVEDCAQAPGGTYKGRYVGAIGDVGCFSISCYKIIGCGEAGMVVTNDENLYSRAAQLAECGGLWRPDRFAPARWDGELFCGTNYRLSETEAAVDAVQLQRLDDVVGRYHAAWANVVSNLKRYREIVPQKVNDRDGFVGYALRFFPESHELGARISRALEAEGVGAGSRGPQPGHDWHLYSEMYPIIDGWTPYGRDASKTEAEKARLHWRRGDCPVADDLYGRGQSIWLDQYLTANDCRAIAGAINKVLGALCTEEPDAAPWF